MPLHLELHLVVESLSYTSCSLCNLSLNYSSTEQRGAGGDNVRYLPLLLHLSYTHFSGVLILTFTKHAIVIILRRIKRFPAKTFTNVGMVQRVIKNRVRAPTHHTGNKSPDTRRGSLASLAIHNQFRSRFIAFKRLCIHCTQVNILRLQDTLKPLSPSLHLATSFSANYIFQ